MREIKFRAWDTCMNKVMVYDVQKRSVCLEYWGCDFEDLVEDGDEENRFVVMQYTDLKDKNGKEIYEGDILDDFCSSGCHNLIYVEFSNNPQVGDYEYGYGYLFHRSVNELEIVGNIYENPELLEAK